MGDITPNFSYYEFRPKGQPTSWAPNSEYQKILIDKLALNLQIVKSEMPKNSYMKITSGVRLLSDYNRLIDSGYKPSKTSDHNFGVSIPLEKGDKKILKFGETYNFAVGASDIVPVGMKVWDLFKLSFRLIKEQMCDFGQVIYEKNPKNGSEWIHYGNNPSDFFSKEIIKLIDRKKFLQSTDGGNSYSIINNI